MSLIFQGFYNDMLGGDMTSPDLRCMAVMSDTTCDTESDAEVFDDFTTTDECDGVGYAQKDLASVTVAYVSADDAVMVDAADFDLDGGGDSVALSTRQVVGLVYYRYVDGTDANDVPWFYVPVGPYTLGGGEFNVTVHTSGIARVRLAD